VTTHWIVEISVCSFRDSESSGDVHDHRVQNGITEPTTVTIPIGVRRGPADPSLPAAAWRWLSHTLLTRGLRDGPPDFRLVTAKDCVAREGPESASVGVGVRGGVMRGAGGPGPQRDEPAAAARAANSDGRAGWRSAGLDRNASTSPVKRSPRNRFRRRRSRGGGVLVQLFVHESESARLRRGRHQVFFLSMRSGQTHAGGLRRGKNSAEMSQVRAKMTL